MYIKEKELIQQASEKFSSAKEAHAMLEASGYSASYRSVRRWLAEARETQITETPAPRLSGSVINPRVQRKHLPPGKYVLTCAQYNTFVHEDFLASLLNFCSENSAVLLVAPIRGYASSKDMWLDPRLKPYLIQEAVQLAPDLVFCADVNVLPTASRPLSGFQSYVQQGSGVLPHTKVHMVSLPRLQSEPPRFLYSTGAITQRNYSVTKAGQIASFHHVYGAAFVKATDGGEFFVRQLIGTDEGSFYDLNKQYTPQGVQDSLVEAIIWGDLHCEDLSKAMLGTMLEVNSELLPRINICHDVLDFGGMSYHIQGDVPRLTQLFWKDSLKTSVKASLTVVGTTLAELRSTVPEIFVLYSNHDAHLERWMNTPKDQTDYKNAEMYYALNLAQVKAFQRKQQFNALKAGLEIAVLPEDHDIEFLGVNDSFVIGNVEVAQHGHLGNNGAKGSPESYRSVGSKVTIGHSHSAGILDGVYSVGCMCNLDLGYNKGPSSWSHSFVIQYPNSKRSIVTIRDERKWK